MDENLYGALRTVGGHNRSRRTNGPIVVVLLWLFIIAVSSLLGWMFWSMVRGVFGGIVTGN